MSEVPLYYEKCPSAAESQSYMKREVCQNLSGDEVDFTNTLILLVRNMLCSKLHCQKGFYSILFSYQIRGDRVLRRIRVLP